VYFIYGNHYCLNVSCEPEGKAGGVLIRALEPLAGVQEMAQARGVVVSGARDLPKLTSGPGRLAEAFGITRERDNGRDLTSRDSGLWIGDDGFKCGKIAVTPRIGLTKAPDHPLRYLLAGSACVSGKKFAA
jgi:DNA-3-methyladenine glycosylase